MNNPSNASNLTDTVCRFMEFFNEWEYSYSHHWYSRISHQAVLNFENLSETHYSISIQSVKAKISNNEAVTSME